MRSVRNQVTQTSKTLDLKIVRLTSPTAIACHAAGYAKSIDRSRKRTNCEMVRFGKWHPWSRREHMRQSIQVIMSNF